MLKIKIKLKIINYLKILTFEGKLVRNVDCWKDLVANIRLLEAIYPIQLQLRKNRLHELANFWANTKITKIPQEDSFSQYLENVKSLENEGLSLETMKMPDELELSKNLFLLKIGKLMEKEDIKFNQAAHIISFQVINMELLDSVGQFIRNCDLLFLINLTPTLSD